MFILDTDHVTIIQRKGSAEHGRLIERMRLYPLDKFFVTIVSFHEQVNGWNRYVQRSRNEDGLVRGYAMFESLLSDYARMNVLPFNADAAKAFAELRRSGVRVGTIDLRIGSIALAT